MLRFEQVAKTYRTLIRRTPAVRGFDLHVTAGEVVGLIGANGAGKTTLIHLALGYLWPSGGVVRLFDGPPDDPQNRRRLGWVPDEPIYPAAATLGGLLDAWLAAHGFSRAERRARREELLQAFGMEHAASRRINTYSLGMQQKASLMLALSHRPELLILDEPFSALDHRSLLLVRRMLADFAAAGGAVLVSSHHLSELESLCSRAVFLVDGVLQREERLDGEGAVRVQVDVVDAGPLRDWLENSRPAWLDEHDLRGTTLHARLETADRLPQLLAELVARGVGIRGAAETTSRLEQAFLELEDERGGA